MIKNIKLITIHLIGFVLLTVLTYYVVSYANFEFEIPFFVRTVTDTDTDNILDENTNETETEVETTEVYNLHNVVNPDDLIDRTELDVDDNIENNDSTEASVAPESESDTRVPFDTFDELRAKGYYISDSIYDRNYFDFAQIKLEYQNIPAFQTVRTSAGRKNIVEPFMDFVVINSSDNIILLDNTGKFITENLSYHEERDAMKIMEARDINNNTVFSRTLTQILMEPNEEGIETAVTNYYNNYFMYDYNIKSFLQTEYEPIYGDRGVPFMYPSYYGANGASNLSRYETNGKWGYFASNTGEAVIAPAFDMAYNFNENTGIGYIWEQRGTWRGYYDYKKLYFINEQGGVLNNSYYAPDTVTFEHLGFFYFDNGLTRAYYREFDGLGQITIERDVIVDKEGREFYVPEDYDIKAYSNGVILLEKNGYYGFMSYTGEWIAQPIFTYAQPFNEGLAVIGFRNGKKALIDTEGNIVIRFRYDYISNCTGGLISLFEANYGWTVLAKMRRGVNN